MAANTVDTMLDQLCTRAGDPGARKVVSDELARLRAIEERARVVADTSNADLHHGRGSARTAAYVLTGQWPDDAA